MTTATNSNESETTENDNTGTSSKRPTHVAYSVKDRGDKDPEWRQIGVGWAHADNKGINVHLDLQPLDGRITLRLVKERN
jgi:hypothetical protein